MKRIIPTLFALGLSVSPAAMACAVISVTATTDKMANIATLTDARSGEAGVAPVDRQNIGRLLDERQLQRLLAPDATAARAEAGRVLRADVLATVARQGDRGECLICDTRQGVSVCGRNAEAVCLCFPSSPRPSSATTTVGDLRVWRFN